MRNGVRARHTLVLSAGLVVAAVLVALVFFRVELEGGPRLVPRFDFAAFLHRLPAHRRWLVPFLLLALTLPAWRALVWRVVAPPPRPPFRDAYHATALGALVHNTVPGKLGPVAAAWLLARSSREPFAAALSSQLVAKLLELGAIVCAGTAAALVVPRAAGLGRALAAGSVLFVVLASAAAVVAIAAPRAGVRTAGRWPRLGSALAALGDGIAGVGRPARLLLALAAAAGPALTAATAYALPLATFGVAPAGGAIVVAVVTFGQLTPGLPVGTGLYWGLAAWAARHLGAASEDAAALAVLTHAATVAANLTIGVTSAIMRRGALADLVRRRRELAGLGRGFARDGRSSRAQATGHRTTAHDARSRSPTSPAR